MQGTAINWMIHSRIFKFVLSQKNKKACEDSKHFAEVYKMQKWYLCVCVCTQAQVGGKPQFWSLALEKAIKGLERGKPQSIIRSFATFLRCLWHPLPWHLSPFPQPWLPRQGPALAAPTKAASSPRANPSICCHGRGAGKALLTPHTAGCWKFLPSAAAFPPTPHKNIGD